MPVKVDRLNVLFYPHPALRQPAGAVEQVTEEVRCVVERMIELMHEHRGVGLAAPQVGLGWRLFVANPSGEEGDDRAFINPVLSETSRQTEVHSEGCLSIPHVTVEVRRPKAVTVQALDLSGERFTVHSDELAARVWQHELDHLDGRLIIDRMSPMDRLANRRLLKELEDRYAEAQR